MAESNSNAELDVSSHSDNVDDFRNFRIMGGIIPLSTRIIGKRFENRRIE